MTRCSVNPVRPTGIRGILFSHLARFTSIIMEDPNQTKGKTMTEPQVPVVPTPPPSTEETKSRFTFNPKVIAGVATAALAAGVAVVIHKLKNDEDGSSSEGSGVTTELFNVND